MSETPPPWDPFGAQPEPAPHSHPLPPPAPPVPPAGSAHRAGRSFPVVPFSFATGGLVLGVVLTLLLSHSSGSAKPKPVAAPAPVSSVSSQPATAPARTTAKASSKAATSSKPAAPVSMPPAAETGLAHAAPTAVQIPRIGVSSTLVSLGLESDGTLQVPSDFAKAGWYAKGAYPGDANEPPALIVGHVDDYKGPAVFFRLKELSMGDKVVVPRADGSVATFVVYKTENYLKSSFPADSVYAPTSRPELRLITCTGQFDSSARSYLSNFVAYAYLESGSG